MTNKNWIRIVQENYRHYSNINIGQNVHNTKFWTHYGKKTMVTAQGAEMFFGQT